MVVISAAIVSRSHTLLARQFVEISRLRVEALLSAFSKLIEPGSREHTYIETETVRYVYLPMEPLYLVLITNKSSNILEDLETLKLLQQVVQDCCQPVVSEPVVLEAAFDIVFAFDEVITFGYRESVTLSQLKQYTEMESHDEKLSDLIRKQKEQEEKDRRKKIEVKLQKASQAKKKEDRRMRFGSTGVGNVGNVGGILSLSSSSSAAGGVASSSPIAHEVPAISANVSSGKGMSLAPSKGMQIGKKTPGPVLSVLEGIATGLGESSREVLAEEAASSQQETGIEAVLNPVAVDLEEVVKAQLHGGGGVKEAELQGVLKLTVLDLKSAASAALRITHQASKQFTYRLHPSLDKTAYERGLLQFRSASGKKHQLRSPLPMLRWRAEMKSADEASKYIPISVGCWPSTTAKGCSMTVEVEWNTESVPVKDLSFTFQCPASCAAEIADVSVGTTYTSHEHLVWTLPAMDSENSSATMEFEAACDASSLFPVNIVASSSASYSDLTIQSCFAAEGQDTISFVLQRKVEYQLTIS